MRDCRVDFRHRMHLTADSAVHLTVLAKRAFPTCLRSCIRMEWCTFQYLEKEYDSACTGSRSRVYPR